MAFKVLEHARVTNGRLWSDASYGNNGAFILESVVAGWRLFIIASDGSGWEHVSVRAFRGDNVTRERIPTWAEMSQVKRAFWGAEDAVMQLHPAEQDYVNTHTCVLHLWRPTTAAIPLPDPVLV